MSDGKIKLNDEMLKNVAGGDMQTWQWLLNDFTVRSNMVNTMEDMEKLCRNTKSSAEAFFRDGLLTQNEYDNAIMRIGNTYDNFRLYLENK